jgi:hypothetical protein
MKKVITLSVFVISFLSSFSQNIISVTFDSIGTKIVTVKKELVLFDSVSNTKFVFRPLFKYDKGSEFYNKIPSYTFVGFEMEQYNTSVTNYYSFSVSYDTKTPSYDYFIKTYKIGYGDEKRFYNHDHYYNHNGSIINTPIKMIMFKNANKECVIKLKDDSEKRYFVELYKELEDNGFYYRKPTTQVHKQTSDECTTIIVVKHNH